MNAAYILNMVCFIIFFQVNDLQQLKQLKSRRFLQNYMIIGLSNSMFHQKMMPLIHAKRSQGPLRCFLQLQLCLPSPLRLPTYIFFGSFHCYRICFKRLMSRNCKFG
ncbi:hypothetical protein AMTRI_Chr04g244070 [Amborella trichopoda]